MTPARCPLVREIEEAATVVRETRDPTVYHWRDWQRMIDLWRLQQNPCYERLRVVLEAAEEMALVLEEEHGRAAGDYKPECPKCQLVERYRGASGVRRA